MKISKIFKTTIDYSESAQTIVCSFSNKVKNHKLSEAVWLIWDVADIPETLLLWKPQSQYQTAWTCD